MKLLNTIHGLTSRVIRKRKAEFAAKGQLSLAEKEKQKEEELKKIIENAKGNEKKTTTYTNLHYVRDDLDEIDENDVGTIFSPFLIHFLFHLLFLLRISYFPFLLSSFC